MENNIQIMIYKNQKSEIEVKVSPSQDTVWLSQNQMAELFKIERSIITKHINNIYSEDELEEKATSAKFTQV